MINDSKFFQHSDLAEVLFTQAPIGLGLSDKQGNLVAYNDMLLDCSGFTAEDIEKIGNVAQLYYDPEARDEILQKTMKEGYLNQHPVKFKKKDGGYFDSLMSLRRIAVNGEHFWLAIVQDISKQVAAESQLKKHVKELERLNELMIDRELQMSRMKKRISELEKDTITH